MEICYLCQTLSFLYPTGCGNDEHEACMLCIKGTTLSRSPQSNNLRSVLKTEVECPYCMTKSSKYYMVKLEQTPKKIKEHDIKIAINRLIAIFDQLWLYQGRNNGWWLFNEEVHEQLEKFSKDINNKFEWVICGQTMEYDFKHMIQRNVKNGSVRCIKQIGINDIDNHVIKGIAGSQ
uniref:WWE domain-containing protein n=1 Tax=viral metagenome TaxID=1070528 RepID=A0A6C0J9J8_9ZZZZ